MSSLKVINLHKSFARSAGSDRRVTVVDDLSLEVGEGEMLALLGASGSGKTTLLRCIGGLETPDAGDIHVGGKPVFSASARLDVPPHQRNMGMVFQSYALWPHMTVAQNVGYPLERRGVARAEAQKRVSEYLSLVDCLEYRERFPHQLSGGQQQRIALARALVAEPSLVLFDEPLSNLDANLREQLRFQIRTIKRRLGFTGIYVTHDHAEANFIADRIAIIGGGRVMQLGPASALYAAPANREVADFLGFANSLAGSIEGRDDALHFRSSVGDLPIGSRAGSDLPKGKALLMCHPSRVKLDAPGGAGAMPGTVVDKVRSSEGSVQYIVELAPGITWQCAGEAQGERPIGAGVTLQLPAEHIHLFELTP